MCSPATAAETFITSRDGSTLIEVLIALVLLGIIASLSMTLYGSTVENVKINLNHQQQITIEEQIITDFEAVLNGHDLGLRVPSTGEEITPDSTCGEFLEAIRPRLQHYRTKFDGSPTLTFNSFQPQHQKEGKVRLSCFRLWGPGASNGRACPLKVTGIRIESFKITCGSRCGGPHCDANTNCRGLNSVVASPRGQSFLLRGKVEGRYLMLPGGLFVRDAQGYAIPDMAYGRSVCGPNYRGEFVPFESDY